MSDFISLNKHTFFHLSSSFRHVMYPVRDIFVASVRIRCCQSHKRPLVPALAHLWATPARIPFPLLTKVSSLALLDFSSLLAKSVGICYSSFSFSRCNHFSFSYHTYLYCIFCWCYNTPPFSILSINFSIFFCMVNLFKPIYV